MQGPWPHWHVQTSCEEACGSASVPEASHAAVRMRQSHAMLAQTRHHSRALAWGTMKTQQSLTVCCCLSTSMTVAVKRALPSVDPVQGFLMRTAAQLPHTARKWHSLTMLQKHYDKSSGEPIN